ncbi:UDP-galactopyranose mutase [Shewanella mangrovi]|uniref:UDP-galactopyranose mutase n=1 Tax=Shewanella mangrovi TaxID=1515746 RepID=A0A094J9E6_9GAMM|nr:UDP-galactopyranose mutase [Shewanella mangrovi]KFZ36540.1 UDP-galactopyranose mutase [Shewanella mangrovi]
MSFDAVVIGAGLSGAVMAERMANVLNWKVLVLEQREHIAGNCFDENDEFGINVHRYGPHLLHSSNNDVWDYLSTFTAWHPYQHRVLAKINDILVPIPFNLTSIERCFSPQKATAMISALREHYGDGSKVPILELKQRVEPLLAELAEFIYRNVFVNYTCKQWGVAPDEIAPEVTARVPVVVSYDDRYFSDTYQALPSKGFTAMVSAMLAHPLITVELNTPMARRVRLDWEHHQVLLDGELFNGHTIYTGMLDTLVPDAQNLPYRALKFKHKHLNIKEFQPVATVNYPNDEAYTRITEFKHLSPTKHVGTSVVYEYPCEYQPKENVDPYYPLFTDSAIAAHCTYRNQLSKFARFIPLGRLAEYRYFDMDDAVANALKTFLKLQDQISFQR